jgi:hypothetical protein
LFNIFDDRAEHQSGFGAGFLLNPQLWLAVGSVALGRLAIVRVDRLRSFSDASYLDGRQFMLCLGGASIVLWLEELRQLIDRRRAHP